MRAPVLTRSGYGEHGRYLIRALRENYEDMLDIYIIPITWGETGWIASDDEERKWLDERINETGKYAQAGGQFDISIQVTIPNEWERMAPINIGVTAGIESTKVAPVWLEKANTMDRVITISEHSKRGFTETKYDGHNAHTGESMVLSCTTPVDIVHYPVKKFESLPEMDLELEYDFNFIAVAQHGPRKNIENTIKWFVEENIDQEVGLIVKTFVKNNSVSDRLYTESMIQHIVSKYPDMKCKVYLLHGDITDAEVHALYNHPKIKCLVSLTHGEGFGLPLFEAAYSGLPIISPGWSGQCDFLYAPFQGSKKKKKKKGKHPYFAEVEYNIQPIPQVAVWDGVLTADSMWCYPQEGSYKMRLRQVRNNYEKWEKKAKALQDWVLKEFESEKKHKLFVDTAFKGIDLSIESWLDEISNIIEEYE